MRVKIAIILMAGALLSLVPAPDESEKALELCYRYAAGEKYRIIT
jgi:hypothetical protein